MLKETLMNQTADACHTPSQPSFTEKQGQYLAFIYAYKRRVKTQCALPNAETAAMLFWALMASGQITMRRVDGWQTLDQAPVKQPIDLAA